MRPLADRIKSIKQRAMQHFTFAIYVEPVKPDNSAEKERDRLERLDQESKYFTVLKDLFDTVNKEQIKMNRFSDKAKDAGCLHSKFLGKALKELNIVKNTYAHGWKWIGIDMPSQEMASILFSKLVALTKAHQPFKLFIEPITFTTEPTSMSAKINNKPAMTNQKITLRTIQRTIDIATYILKAGSVPLSTLKKALAVKPVQANDSVRCLESQGIIKKELGRCIALVRFEDVEMNLRVKSEKQISRNNRCKGSLPSLIITEMSRTFVNKGEAVANRTWNAEELSKVVPKKRMMIGIALCQMAQDGSVKRVEKGRYALPEFSLVTQVKAPEVKLAEIEAELKAQRIKTAELEQKAKDMQDYIALGKKLGL